MDSVSFAAPVFFQIRSLQYGYIHGGVDTSHMGGTHFMAIRYEASFASGCDLPTPKRWPERQDASAVCAALHLTRYKCSRYSHDGISTFASALRAISEFRVDVGSSDLARRS